MRKAGAGPYQNMGSGHYEIRVSGLIDPFYSDQLGGMKITQCTGTCSPDQTILEGDIMDQSALAGILDNLFQLRYPILSVCQDSFKSIGEEQES